MFFREKNPTINDTKKYTHALDRYHIDCLGSGNVVINENLPGNEAGVTVKVTYGLQSHESSAFAVEAKCPTMTQTDLVAVPLITVPNTATTAKTQIILGSAYHSSASTAVACLRTFKLYNGAVPATATEITTTEAS